MALPLFFVAALALSGHCAAMCAFFPLALRGAGGGGGAAGRLALHLAGKTCTYVFIGIVSAAAGVRFEGIRVPLGVASGALLLLLGLVTVVPAAVPPGAARWISGLPACGALGDLLREPRLLTAFSAGIFNGFVPCGLVYAMAAQAADLGSPMKAGAAMLLFGAGTMPVLLLIGFAPSAVPARLRALAAGVSYRLAVGAFCLILGSWTILRVFSGAPHLHPGTSVPGF